MRSAPTPAGEPAPDAAPAVEAEAAPAPAADAAPPADIDPDDGLEEATAKAAPEPEPVDPATTKRLAQVQAAEAKKMAAVQAERKKFEAERVAFEAERKELAEAKARLSALEAKRHDPAALLLALGYGEDDLEAAARQVYGMSKAAAADPKNRDAAARMARERAQATELEKATARLEALEQRIEQQNQAQAAQLALEQYSAKLTAAASPDATPLTARQMAANPDRARVALAQLALEMAQEDGDVPDAVDVVARYEKMRAAELAELGIDIGAMAAKAPEPAKKAAPRSMPANGAGTPPPPQTRTMTHEQRKAAAAAALSSLK